MLLRPSGAWSGPARAQIPATRPPVPETAPVRAGVRLAVDHGSVRIGVARSDPDGILASPLTVVRAGPDALDELAALTASSDAIEVIVGLPTSLSGQDFVAVSIVRGFAAELAWLIIGFYWIVLTVLVVPVRLQRSPLFDATWIGLIPVAAALVLRFLHRPSRRSPPERDSRHWTHHAAVGLLLTWPLAWIALILLGKSLL